MRLGTRLMSALVTARMWLRNRLSRASVTAADGPVVSITSHGERVKRAFAAIESIGAGSLRPSRLILWLGEQERDRSLPSELVRLQRRGLEVMYGPDHGPHTKYYPYVRTMGAVPVPLATADDDILYPAWWLQRLWRAHQKDPDNIVCFRAHRVPLKTDGQIESYRQWPPCGGTQASLLNFATGVSGVLYPPAFLHYLRQHGDAFTTVCPWADDVWLHAKAVEGDYKVRQIQPVPLHFLPVLGTRAYARHRTNVRGGGNDAQIEQTYTQSILAKLERASAAASD